MKRTMLAIVAALMLVPALSYAEDAPKPKAKAKAGKEPVTMAAEDQKWTEIPESHGVMVTNLWGDMNKGAYGGMAKFPAGHASPLHTHTADAKVIVVAGTFLYTPEGGTEKKFGPGSYVMVPGRSKHTSGCADGAPCVLFQEQSAKFDMKPVAPPAAAAPAKP